MSGNIVSLGLDLDAASLTLLSSSQRGRIRGRVVTIERRRNRQKAIDDLNVHNIRYDYVVLVDRFDAKAKVIA